MNKNKSQDSGYRIQGTGFRVQVKKIWLIAFACVLCLVSCVFNYLYAQDKIVAIVNNDIVTQKDLNNFLNFSRLQFADKYNPEELEDKLKSIEPDLLNKLIDDRLILQEAKKEKISVDQNRVKARITDIRKLYGSDREFQNALLAQGLVQADIETKIKEQMLIFAVIDTKVKRRIIINPSEVTDYYENNKKDFILPEQREFDSLGSDNENKAREISQKLKSGGELEELAKKNSLE
ncbi:MAG: SurA N-terminal domain-containing protein, partial [Candidatus Omnitrophota bacterium]